MEFKDLSKEELVAILEEIKETIDKVTDFNSIVMMMAYQNIEKTVERGLKK